VPLAGIFTGSTIVSTRSGSPICQPSWNFGSGGVSAGLPSLAPPSTQAARVAISPSLRRRGSRKSPKCGSAFHGGICRVVTACRIARAQGRASL
jgi:hypothetical protein